LRDLTDLQGAVPITTSIQSGPNSRVKLRYNLARDQSVEEPIFGLGMIEELARHGYRISPGSLYPLLHGLEKKGYLQSSEKRDGKSLRKVYRATPLGRRPSAAAKTKVRELFRKLVEGK
jgi:DNA-binding PadR family transcriptional regulator